jgi:xanthine dehydrogenase accessory factor
VGLSCGGSIEVLVTPVRAEDGAARPALAAALAAAAEGRAAALVRVVTGPDGPSPYALTVHPDAPHTGTLGGPASLDTAAVTEALRLLRTGGTATLALRQGPAGEWLAAAEPGVGDGVAEAQRPEGEGQPDRGGAATPAPGPGGAAERLAGGQPAVARGRPSPGAGGSAALAAAGGDAGDRTRASGGDGRAGAQPCAGPGQRPRPVVVFVETRLPPPRMLVFGAIDFAAALVRVGDFLGYRVTVCDARGVFATPARFPQAADVVVEWPHRYLDAQARDGLIDGRTVVCVLTHDTRFDVPLLTRALRLPVGYVGAMGSRRTHAERLRRLREAGLTERELARLRSPIGLDLGAGTPQETALSIAAEIVADRRGGSGAPLSDLDVPIHHRHGHGDCQWRRVGSGHELDLDDSRAVPPRAEPRAA